VRGALGDRRPYRDPFPELAVLVGQEDLLAVVAALGDVMRRADRHHPRCACHFERIVKRGVEYGWILPKMAVKS
jgi:hypothetical protein